MRQNSTAVIAFALAVGATVNYDYIRETRTDSMITIESNNHRAWTAGIPAQAEIFVVPCSRFGFGIVGFADWNRRKPFCGAWVGVRLGRTG